jgi:hypothetical protein
VRDVVGELGRDRAGLDHDHARIWLQFLAQHLGPAAQAGLRRGVDGAVGAGGPAGDRGDVDQVAAAVAQLVQEHLGGRHAEQVDLDHLAVLGTLLGDERLEQHHAGVVDKDVGAAELLLQAFGCSRQRVAVGDVGPAGQDALSELIGHCLDAVRGGPAARRGDRQPPARGRSLRRCRRRRR